MTSTIEIDSLSVTRGKTEAVRNISVHIDSGEVTGLLGPSGSGKTTLIRSIAGVQKITSGTVTVLSEPAGTKHNRERVGYTTQSVSVYSDITIKENLKYFAALAGTGTKEIEDALTAVDLTGRENELVGNLSGGERSRVSLATTLASNPEIYLLDEPTVGLDPILRRDLWQLFQSIAQSGKTILVSSHVMDEAERCDRVLLMRDGHLIADGTTQELKSRTGLDSMDETFIALAEGGAA